jgi:hypothetical protein
MNLAGFEGSADGTEELELALCANSCVRPAASHNRPAACFTWDSPSASLSIGERLKETLLQFASVWFSFE